jgi:hypothetical protein
MLSKYALERSRGLTAMRGIDDCNKRRRREHYRIVSVSV